MATQSMKKLSNRQRRSIRVRKKIFGTAARPRLSVFRSIKHIYAQVIDDTKGVTIVAASSREQTIEASAKQSAALAVGKLVAERATEKGVSQVVFDRGPYLYHGRVKALAEAAREAGLGF